MSTHDETDPILVLLAKRVRLAKWMAWKEFEAPADDYGGVSFWTYFEKPDGTSIALWYFDPYDADEDGRPTPEARDAGALLLERAVVTGERCALVAELSRVLGVGSMPVDEDDLSLSLQAEELFDMVAASPAQIAEAVLAMIEEEE